ncbi:MAG TPA: oxygenase MpaB family protein, partial [Roseivirga sp.]
MDVALSRQEIELDYFAKEGSIVREIWGKSDTILVIFAGAAAEFALSKAVDWLYFTGRLPSDPLGRLFSTVEYAKRIVFSSESEAFKAIESINLIHQGLEKKRSFNIPDWAYRDVLFMLIDYSIRAYELLERPLKWEEKQEVFNVFYKLGAGLKIPDVPTTFEDW